MNRFPIFFRWLVATALVDWLIGRMVTRSAIAMPKSPPVIAVYQALTVFGQLAFTFTGLLTLLVAIWIAWQSWQTRRATGLAFALPILIVLNTISLFVASAGWLAVGYQLLVMAAAAIVGGQVWRGDGEIKKKIAWSIPALALLAGGLYQVLPAFYVALRWSGPPPFTELLFNVGELLVVFSPVGLWWAVGQDAVSPYKWATIPALAFVAAYLLNPALTAIIAIWSTGLTLYLPWPLYALSLWLASAVVIVSLRRGDAEGWALLLLAAGGYAPQLSTQALLGLAGLWLLNSAPDSQPGAGTSLQPASQPIPVLSQTTAKAGKS